MPGSEAVITKMVTLSPALTVGESLDILDRHSIRCAPVVAEDGAFVGLFSGKQLLTKLLPVSVTMEDGLESIDFIINATPGVAKKLNEILPRKVTEFMDKTPMTVHPETPAWEVIRLLVKHGSPLPVVEKTSRRLTGLVSEQSVIGELKKTIDQIGKNGR